MCTVFVTFAVSSLIAIEGVRLKGGAGAMHTVVAQQIADGIHEHEMNGIENAIEEHRSDDEDGQVALAEIGGVEAYKEYSESKSDAEAGDLTRDTLSCLTSRCPPDPVSMQPSKRCWVWKCGITLSKCLFNTACRHTFKCMNKCASSLDRDAAELLLNVTECLSSSCPGDANALIRQICLGMYCGSDSALCGMNSGCRHGLVCLNQCEQLEVVHHTGLQNRELDSELLEVEKMLQADH